MRMHPIKMKHITEIEEMIGLHDETHNDEEVDVTLIKTIQVDTSVDKDYMEESWPAAVVKNKLRNVQTHQSS